MIQHFFVCLVAGILFTTASIGAEMRLAVTTSFQNSGLSKMLLPQIKKDINLDVHLIVVGTGQALKLGKSGDVDAVLVHSKTAEEAFVEKGYATHRREIMYNDFVFIGPATDPAKIAGQTDAASALTAIKNTKSPFISRGDDSGTHRKEHELWNLANLYPKTLNADWYFQVGAGMGATLNTASGKNAYVMSDRASWLNFANKGGLKILFSGDPKLFNQYAYLPINPARHPHIKHTETMALEKWLVSDTAQTLIGNYQIDGEKLFTPNAATKPITD